MAPPMMARSTRCSASAPIDGADIEHDRFPAQRRPQRRDRRPLDARHGPQMKFRHRHQRAGIAGRDRDVGLAFFHRVDGEPHRRFPAAVPQRLARFVVHVDRDIGVTIREAAFKRRMSGQQRLDDGQVAEQDEFDVGMPRRAQIAAPATTTAAPWSPPMASSAMRTFWGMDRPWPAGSRYLDGAGLRREHARTEARIWHERATIRLSMLGRQSGLSVWYQRSSAPDHAFSQLQLPARAARNGAGCRRRYASCGGSKHDTRLARIGVEAEKETRWPAHRGRPSVDQGLAVRRVLGLGRPERVPIRTWLAGGRLRERTARSTVLADLVLHWFECDDAGLADVAEPGRRPAGRRRAATASTSNGLKPRQLPQPGERGNGARARRIGGQSKCSAVLRHIIESTGTRHGSELHRWACRFVFMARHHRAKMRRAPESMQPPRIARVVGCIQLPCHGGRT